MTFLSMKTSDGRPTSRWGPDKRLEFIDYRLRWDGRLNRSDLSEFFGVSTPQASLDISRYVALAPENVRYDRSERVYLATEAFRPLFPSSSPRRFLNDLLAYASGVMEPGATFLGWHPLVAVAPTPTRTLGTETLVALVGAMRRGQALAMTYQSMKSAAPKTRVISPKAFGHDGFRWHVRAYCHFESGYRDFVIARILSLGEEQPAPSEPPEDTDWNTSITLVLEPHPGLTDAQRRAIALDYGMERGEVRFECRRALLLYTVRNLGLDKVEGKTPKEQQIVLKNHEEISSLLDRPPGK